MRRVGEAKPSLTRLTPAKCPLDTWPEHASGMFGGVKG